MKKRTLVITLLGLCLITITLRAQHVNSTPNFGNQQSNVLFQTEQLERLLLTKKGLNKSYSERVRDSLILQLADFHWTLRQYEKAYFWYGHLSNIYKESAVVRRRFAELNAMHGQYDYTMQLYATLDGWEDKKKGYTRLNWISRDSADWVITHISLDNKVYREFSPLLVDTLLYWSSNVRKNEVIDKLNWDGFRYTHILSSPDTFRTTGNIPQRSFWDTVEYFKKSGGPRLAKQFNNADNSHLYKFELPNRMAGQTKYSSLSTNSESAENSVYNKAHMSISPVTGKVYLNVNKPYTVGAIKSRLLDIVEGIWDNGIFRNLKALTLVDSNYSVLHPAIHPEGRWLIFSAALPGGKGGYDLYQSFMRNDGTWSKAEPVDALNSEGDELFSRFTAKGELVFSSDGWSGYGGLDIYVCAIEDGKWKEKRHLPYPINSRYDDFGWTESATGNRGYFSSDRLGDDDIFQFVYEPKYALLKGTVQFEDTKSIASGVKVILMEVDSIGQGFERADTLTDALGAYAFKIRPNHTYRVKVISNAEEKANVLTYINASGEMAIPAIFIKPDLPKKDSMASKMASTKIKTNENYQRVTISEEDRKSGAVYADEVVAWINASKNFWSIHHEYNEVSIISSERKMIKQIEDVLLNNPDMELIIVSAADCKGTELYNNRLSRQRSFFVKSNFSTAVRSRVKNFWIGKQNLVLPCVEGEYDQAQQQENRYSYMILIRKQ